MSINVIKVFRLTIISLIMYGCSTAAKLDKEAAACHKAIEHGILETAEKHCANAIGEVGELEPEARSERLFILGKVKRQSRLFEEAETLINESLAIEKKQQKPDAQRLAHRQFEMSLVFAGQDKWQLGADYLLKVLPEIDLFSDKEQKSVRNTVKNYISKLKNNGFTQQAILLEGKL